ncbi:titin homolog isoform X2 [Liolophura sinensis]|uniref:titin homolog isoform X2 n=1 Tax=Liolophura sinensis TaxID=3198878 RepID=UPI0031597A05
MGRKLNLQHLSEEECEQILQVIQKDFELRQKEKERLTKVEDSLESEVQKTCILTRQESFNEQCCIRCCRTFGYIFNRKQSCVLCLLNICKNCSEYKDAFKGYICHMCLQSVDYEKQSCEWFYRSVRQRFKRFGSAKVVRSLYKRKSEKLKGQKQLTEGENDSGIDPILSQALESSELNLSGVSEKSTSPSLPLPKAFSSPQPLLKEENSVIVKDTYKTQLQRAQKREDEETEKFRKKFENALTELYRSLDNQTPSQIDYHGNKYGDFVTNYRNRFRDLLSNLSDSLQKIHNHADGNTGQSKSSSRIRQTLSKVVENAVGDTVDWQGSDEAVSDLSTSTEDGNDIDTSYQDQLAQVLITKVVDRHRKVAEEKEKLRQKEREKEKKREELEKAKQRRKEIKAQEEALQLEQEKEAERAKQEADKNRFNYDAEFEKLIKFSQGSSSRPKLQARQLQEEKLAPVEEVPVVKVTKPKEETELGLLDRVMGLEKLHDPHPKLPDFSVGSLGFNEVDPDLMSLSHSEREDNGYDDQDYLSESTNSLNRKLNRSWQDNWILGHERGSGLHKRATVQRVKSDLSDSMYVHVPENDVSPRVGETDAEDLSDLSENEDKDSPSDDDDNAFYAQTSNEIERVSNRINRTASITDSFVQTDDSDLDASKSSLHLHGMKSKHSVDPALKLRLSESLDTSIQSDDSSVLSSIQERKDELKSSQKFQEMLIPSENNDPKFDLPPESTTAFEGEAIKLVCRVSGTEPIDVFWYRADDDELREIEDCEKYDVTNEGNRHTVTIFNPSHSDAGQYSCVALSESGRCCQYFAIRIKENTQELKAPEFMRGLEDIEVVEGRSVKFRCKIKGYPQPRVTWYKDGQRIAKSHKDYKVDKFGNRDYILGIEYATLDHDAEYTVKATNLAGECKQSAQLLVLEEKEDLDETEDKVQRSALTISTSSQKSKLPAQKNRTKENQEIANLSQKMEMTRNDVSNAAEDMLSTAGELSMIHAELDAMNRALADMEEGLTNNNNNIVGSNSTNHHSLLGNTFSHQVIDDYNVMKTSAGNVRSMTATAFNVIQSAEDVIQQERANQNFVERKSLRDAYVKPSYVDSLTVDVKMRGVEREESKTSVDSGVFSIIGDERNGFQRTSSGRFDSKRMSDSGIVVADSEILSEGPPRKQLANENSRMTEATSRLSTHNLLSSTQSPPALREATPEKVQVVKGEKIVIGLKPVSDKYGRDYVVNQEESEHSRKRWEVNLNSYSPRADIVNRNPMDTANNTEDKIYMTAGKVYSLEEKIGSLEKKLKTAENKVASDRLSDLEDEVARTVAQVEQSEHEVHRVETVVAQLRNNAPAGQQIPKPRSRGMKQYGDSSISISAQKPESSGVSEKRSLVSETKERDVPPCQSEYDARQYQLPSVNRLKNMFSSSDRDDGGGESAFRRDPNLKAVHSITARSFNKQRLAEFRQRNRSSESSDVEPQLETIMHTAPSQDTNSKGRELGARSKKYPAPQPPVVQTSAGNQQTASSFERRESFDSSSGAIPKSPISPKIKTGSIMARAAFWDKRIQDEIASDDLVTDSFPSMLRDQSQVDF